MLSPQTVLNGGEQGQEHAREEKEKIEDPSQDQPKWWRSGAVNLFGLTFTLDVTKLKQNRTNFFLPVPCALEAQTVSNPFV